MILRFKLYFAYVQELVSLLLIESEHRAYRYQLFFDDLNKYSDDTWDTRLLFKYPQSKGIRPFDKEAFIATMKSIYTIPHKFYEMYF